MGKQGVQITTSLDSSPSRKVCACPNCVPSRPVPHVLTCIWQAKKAVSYAESSDEDDGEVFAALNVRRSRQRRSRAAVPEEDEDDYEVDEKDLEEADDGTPCPLRRNVRPC